MKILVLSDLQWHIFALKKNAWDISQIAERYKKHTGFSCYEDEFHKQFEVSPKWFTNLEQKNPNKIKGKTIDGNDGWLKDEVYINLMLKNLISPLEYFKLLINKQKPDLIIFSGDVIADGGVYFSVKKLPEKIVDSINRDEISDHGFKANFSTEFKLLLEFLEEKRIFSVTIKGNHDECSLVIKDYENIFKNKFKYAQEISNKYTEINGVKLLGLPFSATESIKNCRKLINEYYDKEIDIIVAHPSTKRRLFLLSLEPKFLVCGHDEKRLCKINRTIMLNTNYCISKPYVYSWMLPQYWPQELPTFGIINLKDKEVTLVDEGEKFTISNKINSRNLLLDNQHYYSSYNNQYPLKDEDLAKIYSGLLNIKAKMDKDINYKGNLNKYKNEITKLMRKYTNKIDSKFPASSINQFFLGIKDYRN